MKCNLVELPQSLVVCTESRTLSLSSIDETIATNVIPSLMCNIEFGSAFADPVLVEWFLSASHRLFSSSLEELKPDLIITQVIHIFICVCVHMYVMDVHICMYVCTYMHGCMFFKNHTHSILLLLVVEEEEEEEEEECGAWNSFVVGGDPAASRRGECGGGGGGIGSHCREESASGLYRCEMQIRRDVGGDHHENRARIVKSRQ